MTTKAVDSAIPGPGWAALILFVWGVGLSGCSGAFPDKTDQTQTDGRYGWVRQNAPFDVVDLDSERLDQPFLGGFNVPRPQFVDIDGDGDADLFVQENTGAIRFFEQTGNGYTWRTDRYDGLDVGEWFRFTDFDGDGDFDLLAEERFSYIRAYENQGTAQLPQFELVADTLRDSSGDPLFSDRQNIPNVTDIDCDGRPDLFIGRITGTVMRYESVGVDADGLPRFELITEQFEGIEIIGQAMSLHGANTLTFGDIDRDGDQDLFWGDFFEPGILLLENMGRCDSPSFRSEPRPFPRNAPLATSGYNAPSVFDLNGDGDLDMAVGVLGGAFNANNSTVENLYLVEQTRPGIFEVTTRRLLPTLDVGSDSVPRLTDLDGDGDLDLLVANKIEPGDQRAGRVFLYENTGSARDPEFQSHGEMPLAATFHQTVASGDLDGDGDADLLVGKWNRETAYFENTGNTYNLVDDKYVLLSRGSNSTPALADLDADGDLDLMIGEASGALNYYRNAGTPSSPVFELVSDTFGDIDVGRRSVPAFWDMDADGDLDMFVGSELGGVVYFENTGSAQNVRFEERGAMGVDAPNMAAPAIADLDGDGRPEMLIGGVSGGLLYFDHR